MYQLSQLLLTAVLCSVSLRAGNCLSAPSSGPDPTEITELYYEKLSFETRQYLESLLLQDHLDDLIRGQINNLLYLSSDTLIESMEDLLSLFASRLDSDITFIGLFVHFVVDLLEQGQCNLVSYLDQLHKKLIDRNRRNLSLIGVRLKWVFKRLTILVQEDAFDSSREEIIEALQKQMKT